MYGSCLMRGTYPVGNYVTREASNQFRPVFLDDTLHAYIGYFNWHIQEQLHLPSAVPRCIGDQNGEQTASVWYHNILDDAQLLLLCRYESCANITESVLDYIV
jgi:hypothetical protein